MTTVTESVVITDHTATLSVSEQGQVEITCACGDWGWEYLEPARLDEVMLEHLTHLMEHDPRYHIATLNEDDVLECGCGWASEHQDPTEQLMDFRRHQDSLVADHG